MITMQYRITVHCDTCNKAHTETTVGLPPMGALPIQWIQAQPPGSRETKEFCSIECLSSYKAELLPWEDEHVPESQ